MYNNEYIDVAGSLFFGTCTLRARIDLMVVAILPMACESHSDLHHHNQAVGEPGSEEHQVTL